MDMHHCSTKVVTMGVDDKLFREGRAECEALTIYERVARVPGYFNADDATHFALVLGMQNFAGPSGDILEIGTWFGRSAGYLATFFTARRTTGCLRRLQARDQRQV